MRKVALGLNATLDTMASVPSSAILAVEGPHFTIRHKLLPWGADLQGKGIFYFDAAESTPTLAFETHRVPWEDDARRCWVVLTLGDGDTAHLPDCASAAKVRSIVPADAHHCALVRQAIAMFRARAGSVSRSLFFLLIGDLRLPKELRRSLDWAIPANLREVLDDIDSSDLVLLAESTCQNKGRRSVLKHAEDISRDDHVSAVTYREQGYAIIDADRGSETGGYWLCADRLLEPEMVGHPVIALTKYRRSTPSCAVTLAGKLILLASQGISHHVATCDADEDELIRQKSVEGSIVASLLVPGFSVVSTIVVAGRNDLTVDRIDPDAWRGPGRFADPAALIAEVARTARQLGIGTIQGRVSDVCCETPPF